MGLSEGYRIVNLDEGGREALTREFGSKFGDVLVFENILKHAHHALGCRSVLIEEEYIDKDYRNEFSNLYSKMFKKVDSYCKRLHFFRAQLSDEKQVFTEDEANLGYCGYTVIRPLEVGKVGRTSLAVHRDNPHLEYPLCTTQLTSHLQGRDFNIEGSPFIQQDSMVMCCAHAAIWMAARYMHEEFGFPEWLPYEISENASRYFTLLPRILPTEGLTALEISNALTNMGYSPTMHSKPKLSECETEEGHQRSLDSWDPTRWIYRYIESGIPVIALFPDHVATIIGHTFAPDRWRRQFHEVSDPDTLSACYSHNCVDGYIMHDDAVGPYRILPVSLDDEAGHVNLGREDLLPLDDEDSPYRSLDDMEEFIVPLPEKVYILAEHIDDIVKGLLLKGPHADMLYQNVLTIAKRSNRTALEFLRNLRSSDNPMLLRVFFAKTVDYKRGLSEPEPDDQVHPRVLEEYRKLHMPRFVWIIQITNPSYYCKESQEERKILGEILLDATANKLGLPYLAIHLPGILFIRHPGDESLSKPIEILDDRPYRIRMR